MVKRSAVNWKAMPFPHGKQVILYWICSGDFWNFSILKTLVKLKSYFFLSLIILSSETDTQVCDVDKGSSVCSSRMVIYWYIVFNFLIHVVVFIDNFRLCRDRWWWGLWCKTQRSTIFSHQWRCEEVFKRYLLDYVTTCILDFFLRQNATIPWKMKVDWMAGTFQWPFSDH